MEKIVERALIERAREAWLAAGHVVTRYPYAGRKDPKDVIITPAMLAYHAAR